MSVVGTATSLAELDAGLRERLAAVGACVKLRSNWDGETVTRLAAAKEELKLVRDRMVQHRAVIQQAKVRGCDTQKECSVKCHLRRRLRY